MSRYHRITVAQEDCASYCHPIVGWNQAFFFDSAILCVPSEAVRLESSSAGGTNRIVRRWPDGFNRPAWDCPYRLVAVNRTPTCRTCQKPRIYTVDGLK